MTDLYLIAHKVRNEPAFDTAERMQCPECNGYPAHIESINGCHECDNLGFWWIIPTSGHRAYPYWSVPLNHCIDTEFIDGEPDQPHVPPEGLQDHYHLESSTQAARSNPLDSIFPKAPTQRIVRRI